ncbi:MAG: hypothetical protein KL863_22410 [Rhizobium sp.]|nr:hypothetical protein [Rhizobium sp.]
MALSKSDILANPALHAVVKQQSSALLAMTEPDPRLAAVFATQQRWLMSHVGLALYFRGLAGGAGNSLQISRFLEAVVAAKIASRNTADSYIKELIHYKYVEVLPSSADRRIRPLAPAPNVLSAIDGWVRIHLHALDRLSGGNRLAVYQAAPDALSRIQPLIADSLLDAHAVRHPAGTFSLFTWLDNGGTVMDWMMANMEEAPKSTGRIAVGAVSTVEMAQRLTLSRTHLARKLKEAEDMGSLGWEGRRGQSVMWVSRAFCDEYATAQAIKLSIVDAAHDAAFEPAGVSGATAG